MVRGVAPRFPVHVTTLSACGLSLLRSQGVYSLLVALTKGAKDLA